MKVKDEYKGKTIVKNTSLGNMTVIVDNIDVSKYRYYVSIGLGYLFEKESISSTEPEVCIKYEGIEQEETEAPTPKPKAKAKRKKKTNADTDTI